MTEDEYIAYRWSQLSTEQQVILGIDKPGLDRDWIEMLWRMQYWKGIAQGLQSKYETGLKLIKTKVS